MNMIRWSPMLSRPSYDVADDVSRLLDGFFTEPSGGFSRFLPAVDVEETSEEYVLRADLPGIQQKDVKVTLLNDTLTIRGERTDEREKKGRNFRRIERSTGSFERSFTFGAAVKNEGVKAQYRDGVLEVHVPKAEAAKVREIDVQVAAS